MRAIFVLTTVILALTLGVVAGTSENRLWIRALIIGIVPAMWGVSRAVERLTERDMWHFGAPYPYRWMRHRAETAIAPPSSGREPIDVRQTTEDRSRLPLAA